MLLDIIKWIECVNKVVQIYVQWHTKEESFIKRKKSISPLTYGGGLHNPLTYETVYITPELSETGQITSKAVSKNHSKSQKNRKMKNPIVLDSK